MKIVLLSGGSGKRLWPLSNDIRSKQFIKIFKDDKENYSMIQKTYKTICDKYDKENVLLEISKLQISEVMSQLGKDVEISAEPYKRNTFPAIALACTYLQDIKHISLDETIIVCPVDHYVDLDFYDNFKKLDSLVQNEESNLFLMGIKPNKPSSKFGYIFPVDDKEVTQVKEFKEKPTREIATEYIKKNSLWNGGIFAFKLGYAIRKSHELIDFEDYYDLYSKYESLDDISFDRAVVEKEEKIGVLKYNGNWKDLGTWDTLTSVVDNDTIGNGVLKESENANIVNELDIPILGVGLKDLVISASSSGILVSDKNKSTGIKPYVNDIFGEAKYGEKSFGHFHVIDVDTESQTVKILLHKGNRMSYHSHNNRNEVWIVVSGEGRVIVDGMTEKVSIGDVITVEAKSKHTIIADSELKLIEVQIGKDMDLKDKEKFDLENENE